MLTEKDRKICDGALEKAMEVGEKIGDFVHASVKGLIRVLIVSGAVLLFGGLFFIVSMLKRSFGKRD